MLQHIKCNLVYKHKQLNAGKSTGRLHILVVNFYLGRKKTAFGYHAEILAVWHSNIAKELLSG